MNPAVSEAVVTLALAATEAHALVPRFVAISVTELSETTVRVQTPMEFWVSNQHLMEEELLVPARESTFVSIIACLGSQH